MVMKVFCSLNDAQTYCIAPYCTVLPHAVFKESWPPFTRETLWSHTSWKMPFKRWVSCYCGLHFLLMTPSDIQNETFPKQMLVRYTDLCLPIFFSHCRTYRPQVSCSDHVTGCSHNWRSWDDLISPGKFWAHCFLSLKFLNLVSGNTLHRNAVTQSVHSSDVCRGFQVHVRCCHVTLTYSRSFTVAGKWLDI